MEYFLAVVRPSELKSVENSRQHQLQLANDEAVLCRVVSTRLSLQLCYPRCWEYVPHSLAWLTTLVKLLDVFGLIRYPRKGCEFSEWHIVVEFWSKQKKRNEEKYIAS